MLLVWTTLEFVYHFSKFQVRLALLQVHLSSQSFVSSVLLFVGALVEWGYFGGSLAYGGFSSPINDHAKFFVGSPWQNDGGAGKGAVYVMFAHTAMVSNYVKFTEINSFQKISSTSGSFTGAL